MRCNNLRSDYLEQVERCSKAETLKVVTQETSYRARKDGVLKNGLGMERVKFD
jgi:hypothetical protein